RLLRKAAQQISGMVCDDERRAPVFVHAPAQAAEARLRLQQPARGGLAERDDELRADELGLAIQERGARGGLVERRRSIAGRPALHDVGDVGVAPAREAFRGEHAVEELPGLAHERLADLVLVRAGPLADEEPRAGLASHAENGLLALLAQSARGAFAHAFA